MMRRTFVKSVTVAGASLGVPIARQESTPEREGTPVATPVAGPGSGYAPVNGLEMYYEIHGAGEPLVLLHGGLATIAFGATFMSMLAETRLVIAVEQQGHGHTADIPDRPLTYEQMVEDTAALMRYLGIANADIVGYSLGGTTALGLGLRHPDLVRRVVTISGGYRSDGLRPENIAGIQATTAEALAGSPIEQAQLAVAPNPEDWPLLIEKIKVLSTTFAGWAPADLQAMTAPTMVALGDTDAMTLDHALDLLRLRGGDVNGDFVGVPPSRLAVLPGATHFSVLSQIEMLRAIVVPYLAEPLPGEA